MDPLKEKFKNYALAEFKANRALLKAHGDVVIDDVKVSQVFGGMRGIKSMLYETSELDAYDGIRFRGNTIPELREKLPRVEGGKEPLPEGLFWLMLVNEIPSKEEVDWLSAEWRKRSTAYIYRRAYFNNEHIAPNPNLDWAGNFAHMLGIEGDDFKSLMRLYLTIHADHEGGNASAHTSLLTGSTLSDPYLAFASGMNSLAGPLHGLANQEVIKWIFEMMEDLGTQSPTKDQIAEYVQKTLSEGKVIPGYGHAVLRQPDPRFTAQRVFAEANIKGSDAVETVWKIFEVVPPILKGLGKVKNPWPNVDAHSGAILVHYGLNQFNFYTVLFGVSRGLGILAGLCWSRALGLPLERPKSLTSARVKSMLADKGITVA